MKYLINVHMQNKEVRTDIFFNTMPEIEEYVKTLRAESVPFFKVVVYDNQTREAVRIFKADK